MYQLTREDLAEDNGQGANVKKVLWVKDDHFNDGDVVDFNIIDFALMEMKDEKTHVSRYNAKQKMMILSGEHKGKEYTHTWWDVLEPGNQDQPGRSLPFLTKALKRLGMPEELLVKPVTEVLNSTVGRSFTAKCVQTPKKKGNGVYTNWYEWHPLI